MEMKMYCRSKGGKTMQATKSLTIIICADVKLTWLSEVPLEHFTEVEPFIQTRVEQLLSELFAGAGIRLQPIIIDDRTNIMDIIADD
jgi:hypothetical protein